jgi:hypothetical protein
MGLFLSPRIHFGSSWPRPDIWNFGIMSWHAWESDAENPNVDPYELDAIESSAELAEMIIDLKRSHHISAKQACLLAWWSSRVGGCGLVALMACNPATQSGHFSRHFDTVTGLHALRTEAPHYHIELPGHRRCDATRSVELVPVLPPHEAISAEVDHHGVEHMQQLLAQAIADNKLPPAYFENDIVKENPAGTVNPIVLYVDAIPFSRTDAAIGFFTYSLLTAQRTLTAVLRKTELCQCGCKGWCTFYVVFLMLHWSYRALRKRALPTSRHDNTPFHPDR